MNQLYRMGAVLVVGLMASTGRAGDEAAEKLEASRAAIAKLQSVVYEARVEEGGAGGAMRAPYGVRVAARRVQSGGWAVTARSPLDAEPEADAQAEDRTKEPGAGQAPSAASPSFFVAFDGATARSLRDAEQVLVEMPAPEWSDVPLFFADQGGGAGVAWEMLAASPLEVVKDAKLTLGAAVEVEGTVCDWIEVASPAPTAGVGGATSVVRWALGKDDHLIRRVERATRAPTGKDGAPVETVASRITMTMVRPDVGLLNAVFVLSAPDGYRVKPIKSRTAADRAAAQAKERKDQEDAVAAVRASTGTPGLLVIGSEAPAWTLTDESGKEISLASLRGRVVVIDFWATWCGPCKAAMPGIQRIHEQFKDRPVSVFGVDTWESGDAPAYMKEKGYTYGLLLKGDEVAKAYKVSGIPTFYVIGPDGRIVWSAVGAGSEHEKKMAEFIEKATKDAGL